MRGGDKKGDICHEALMDTGCEDSSGTSRFMFLWDRNRSSISLWNLKLILPT